VTAMCGENLEDTRELVGRKLGFSSPASCRLFNKYGAEIDHIDLVLHDDLLYASAVADFPMSRTGGSRPTGMGAMSMSNSMGGEKHAQRPPSLLPASRICSKPLRLAVSAL